MQIIEGLNTKRVHEFEVARTIAYTIHCHNTDNKNRMSIYDFWPLPSDPTKEEREEMARREEQEKIRKAAYPFQRLS